MNLLEGLNDKQYEAVVNTEGPCLIIAGAGSGKTKVLTHKIAYLISENKAKPWDILAFTFTNKAANEMKTRVEGLIGDMASDMWMGTFHSICVRILRKQIDRIGFDTSFVIFDTSDQKTLIKQIVKNQNLDDKLFSDRSVLSEISNAKNDMLEPEAYTMKVRGDYRREKIAEIYEIYQRKLKENNAKIRKETKNICINRVSKPKYIEVLSDVLMCSPYLDILYGDRENPRLKNVTFDIKGNSINSIVGISGAGKSGVVDLLLRLKCQDLIPFLAYLKNINFRFFKLVIEQFVLIETQYDEVQNSFSEIEKRNTDLVEKNKSLSLENVMTRAGFKEEDFKDISAMRYSMYGDLDDVKAIQSIKEKYVNTYFPTKEEPKKDDLPINNGVSKPVEPKVSRLTSIKEIMKK